MVVKQKRTIVLPIIYYDVTYIILLSFEFLAKVKLLSFQLHHPLPHLTSLLPRHKQKFRFVLHFPIHISSEVRINILL